MSEYQQLLDEIPDDWKIVAISKLGKVISGGTPARDVPAFWGGDTPWITPGDISKLRDKFVHKTSENITKHGLNSSGANLLPENSLLVTSRATLGAKVVNAIPIATNQGFKSIIFHQVKDTDFYYHFFDKVIGEMKRRASGTTFLEISGAEFSSIPLPSPSDEEKKTIANILDTLDTQIRQTKAIIAKLKQVKQGLLHDLLTRGIDANGQLRPPREQAPELYKDSPLGWIPTEWEVSNVGEEFKIDSGITLGSHRLPRNNPQPYLRVANIHRDDLHLDTIKKLESSNSEVLTKGLSIGDLLVVEGHASTKEIGRCAVANELVRGMLFQNHLFRLKPKRLSSAFGLLWMNSHFSQAYWRCEAATSSGLNTINRTKLDILKVLIPSDDEQGRIVTAVQSFKSRLKEETDSLLKLKKQKNGLMGDLLTGRVRVTDLIEQQRAS